MTDEKTWLNHLLKNGVVELRCFKDDVVKAGIYDNLESLIKNIKYAMSDGWTIYNTINPSSLIATNSKLRPFQRVTKNSDITRLKTLFFDFDPVREKNTAATHEQVGDAYKVSSKMVSWLKENGFPSPLITGFSGNGCHEYYAINLDVSDKPLIDDLYIILNKRFNTDTVSFDTSVKNSARIARTFGTINKKSDKVSRCEYNFGGVVTRDMIEAITKKYAPPKVTPRHFVNDGIDKNIKRNMQILGDCASAGLNPVETPESDKYWISCINEASHGHTTSTDTVLWLSGDGYFSYHCSHDHCSHLKAIDLQHFLN